MQVVVVGAGLMGSQIGCEYALGGHRVLFVARRPAEVRARVDAALDLVGQLDLHDPHRIAEADAGIDITSSIAKIDAEVELVVESVVEDLAVKGAVLREAAERFPTAILASNTSSLSITRIGEEAGAPERTVGTHYWNPPLLMPLVEVISGEFTTSDVVERVSTELRRLGKRPVHITRDVPGFVWNRLQLALVREAAWIVENGVATPDVVDEIVRDGLARRWRLTGPFQTVALGGPDTFTRVAANLFPALSDATALHDIGRWLNLTDAEKPALREQRDAELLAELQRDRDRE